MNANEIRKLCINHQWFTAGTNSQYEKMFELVRSGASTHDVALAIWLSTESETIENIEEVIRKTSFNELKMRGKQMNNRRFECFSWLVSDITANIKSRADSNEIKRINDWWEWILKNGLSVSEWDFCNMVDVEMPALAERCAAEVEDEIYNAYVEGGDKAIVKYME